MIEERQDQKCLVHLPKEFGDLLCTVAAVALSNSLWRHFYFAIWEIEIGFHIGPLEYVRSMGEWINDGSMTFFSSWLRSNSSESSFWASSIIREWPLFASGNIRFGALSALSSMDGIRPRLAVPATIRSSIVYETMA